MEFSRSEFNVATGRRVVVEQFAYANAAGVVIILDAVIPAPEGFTQIFELPGEPSSQVFNRLLASLNADYQKDVDAFNKAFSLAIMFDGPTEEAKKANIRAQYTARKTKYAADVAALRAQYGA